VSNVVLVTQLEFAKGEEIFRSESRLTFEPVPPEEQSLAEAVIARRCRAVIVGVTRYTGSLYEALGTTGGSQGALIARFGVGHDSVDKSKAMQHGIIVTNTPGTLDQSVAEHALWLMGSLVKHIPAADARFRVGEFIPEMGAELRGKTLGVIGFGGIGRRVAAMAHFGFGMRVWATGRRSPSELAKAERMSIEQIKAAAGVEEYTPDVESVLRAADVVSIHLPANEQTRYFVNAARLALLKPDALLINTARGSLVDERALYDALSQGHIAGAALDVFEREPYEPASPNQDLRGLSNVVLTPHIGSNTRTANNNMARSCAETVTKFFENRFDDLPRVG
jgi:lactate dehydrogenase-like 2-hydroxyacid dehydrogenase